MTAPMLTYDATIEAIRGRLVGVAPTFRGEDESKRSSAPPRIVFVWRRITEAAGNRALAAGSNPRHAQSDAHEIEVHCWGKTLADCELLRAAVIGAVRFVVRGRRYEDLGSVPSGEGKPLEGGMKIVVGLRLFVALPEVRVAASPTATAGTLPTSTVVPATFPTATIETVTNDPKTLER